MIIYRKGSPKLPVPACTRARTTASGLSGRPLPHRPRNIQKFLCARDHDRNPRMSLFSTIAAANQRPSSKTSTHVRVSTQRTPRFVGDWFYREAGDRSPRRTVAESRAPVPHRTTSSFPETSADSTRRPLVFKPESCRGRNFWPDARYDSHLQESCDPAICAHRSH
jgi:hypothetical protein